MDESLDERERLLHYVAESHGHFSLTMARYVHEGLARVLWEEARDEIEQHGLTIAVVDFAGMDEDVDILERIGSLAVGVDGAFVVGLEELLVTNDDRPRSTAAIATFNFNRDLLRDRFSIPIVLWLSERAARAFALLASDTFDILRTTFEFPEAEHANAGERSEPAVNQPPRWLRTAPEVERPQLESRRQLLESLYADGEPGSAATGDLAASIASVWFSLGSEDLALHWLARAAEVHEQAGSIGAAATDRRRRAEFLLYRSRFDEASQEIELASVLAKQVIGTDDALALLQRRPDIVAIKAALERHRNRQGDTDIDLLERWQQGDNHAGSKLLERHFKTIWRFFAIRTPEDDQADLIQEVFIRITRAKTYLRKGTSFRAFLMAIAQGVLVDHFRKRYRRHTVGPLDDDDIFLDADSPEQNQAALELSRALATLPPDIQQLLELYYLEGWKLSELAELFGVSENSLKARLRRAQEKLRVAFDREARTLADVNIEEEFRSLGRRLGHH